MYAPNNSVSKKNKRKTDRTAKTNTQIYNNSQRFQNTGLYI